MLKQIVDNKKKKIPPKYKDYTESHMESYEWTSLIRHGIISLHTAWLHENDDHLIMSDS